MIYKILRNNSRSAGAIWAELDNNFIAVIKALIKVAYPNLTLKGYAETSTAEPSAPSVNDCYLVIAAGTIWSLTVEVNNIVYWNGSAWAILPEKLTELNAKLNKVEIITEDSGNFTFSTTHVNTYLRASYATNITATVPLDSTANIAVGTIISIVQSGDGTVTLQGETDGVDTVTLNAANNGLSTSAKFAGLQIIKVGANEWDVIGGTTV